MSQVYVRNDGGVRAQRGRSGARQVRCGRPATLRVRHRALLAEVTHLADAAANHVLPSWNSEKNK